MKKLRLIAVLCIFSLCMSMGYEFTYAEETDEVTGGELVVDTIETAVENSFISFGGVMVEMTSEDIKTLYNALKDEDDDQEDTDPFIDWVDQSVKDYNDSVYTEGSTDMTDLFLRAGLSSKYEDNIDGLKEDVNKKILNAMIKNSEDTEILSGMLGTGVDIYELIDSIGELKEKATSGEPTAALDTWLALNGIVVDGVDLVGEVFDLEKKCPAVWKKIDASKDVLAYSVSLWEEGMKLKEWKDFVAENEENFTAAFWGAAFNGWGEGMSDLPRELYNIFSDGYISIEQYEKMTALDFIKHIIDQLKPTKEVNVYKPNIYLYADEPLEVQVEFLQEYLLTETIPEYSLGWDTLVQGDGLLICQDEEHDYLFYESLADSSMFEKETGWIIYAETREEQLLEVLALYDFNEKETKDFMEFWMEKLEADVDFVMYPQDTGCVDKQMPIKIVPEPTKITRIWFGFETYLGQEVETPQVEPIQRDGFTVVEWGGFILDERCEE